MGLEKDKKTNFVISDKSVIKLCLVLKKKSMNAEITKHWYLKKKHWMHEKKKSAKKYWNFTDVIIL